MNRFIKRYGLDVIMAIVGTVIVISISMVSMENLAVMARKMATFGIWSVVWYISRVLKIGTIDWQDKDWRHIYAMVYMVSTAIIFALG